MDWTKFDLNHATGAFTSLAGSLRGQWYATGVWPLLALLVAAICIGLYGERLTRVIILGVSITIGATLGQHLASWLTLPLWPTVILAGALGGIVSFVFYRYALGLMLAAVLALVCGAWSANTNLDATELSSLMANLSVPQPVAQPSANRTDMSVPFNYVERVQRLWQWVQDLQSAIAAKPGGQKHLIVMMLAGAAVGFLLGLVLGRMAAMLWTSLLGGIGVVAAIVNLSIHFRPEWGGWMADNRQYVLGAAAAVALVFLARQSTRRKVVAVPVEEVAGSADKS